LRRFRKPEKRVREKARATTLGSSAAAACELDHARFVIVVTADHPGGAYFQLTEYEHAGLEEQTPQDH